MRGSGGTCEVGVCISGGLGGHMWQGDMHGGALHSGGGGGGRVCQGTCMAEGGVHGRRACMVGGHAWQWACVAGEACMACMPPGRYYEIRSMSGWYTSYWNAFLFC